MEFQPVIYLIDDNVTLRDLMKMSVERKGYQVRTYSTAQEFLDDYDPVLPGCIVVDLYMPGMDGLALQEQVIKRGIEAPVIFVTGQGDTDMEAKAKAAGAIGFLVKPYRSEQLIELIQQALG
ncbi:MAG: response regulator [Gammaproteobacteria bacterium]|nr:response regulator [Gammaproteobacteria bacterium]